MFAPFIFTFCWRNGLYFSCFFVFHVHSHCLTLPRALWVLFFYNSVSLEILYKNSNVSFKYVWKGTFLFFLTFHPSKSNLYGLMTRSSITPCLVIMSFFKYPVFSTNVLHASFDFHVDLGNHTGNQNLGKHIIFVCFFVIACQPTP